MPKLKRVYDKSYMVISNHVFEDPNLTLKAKGLFGYLWSRPDDWNFFITELVIHFKGGRDQAMSALDELEKAGYLLRSRVRNELGQLTNKSTWLLSDIPKKTWIEQKKKFSAKKKSSAKKKKVVKKQVQRSTPNKSVDKSTKPKSENPTLEKPMLENPTLLNTNQTKYLLDKILSLSLSKPLPKIRTVDKSPAIDYERDEKLNHIIFKFNQARAKYHTPIVSFSKTERDQLANAIGSKSLDQLEKQLEPIIDNVAIFAKQYPAGYFISSVRNLPEVNINA